jgi:hypothetical protein
MQHEKKMRTIGCQALLVAALMSITGCGGGGIEPSATNVGSSVDAKDKASAAAVAAVSVAATDVAANATATASASTFKSSSRTLIDRENAKTSGVTNAWVIATADHAANGEIEGYASSTSVGRGGNIRLLVNVKDPANDPQYAVRIYRMGWYGGKGARQVMGTFTKQSRTQAACPMVEAATRLIECNWTTSVDLDIPRSTDPTEWMSGIYLAKLTTTRGKSSYITFVVRDDARRGDLLFQASVTTYAAYNNWGGYSMYVAPPGSGQDPAHKVSFNRPYANDSRVRGQGAGDFLFWEVHALRFIEREGYDVLYTTNIQTHAHPERLRDFRAFLSVGHDEYWTRSMRDAIEGARNDGVHLAFLGANMGYWGIRLEPSTTGSALRTVVGYKYWPQRDPLGATSQATVQWRQSPLNRPEAALIGVQYDFDPVDGDMVIDDCGSSWICSGTGLRRGDRLVGLLGYEVDTLAPSSPQGIVSLATSRYIGAGGQARESSMTYYRHRSGARVFATGSMQWNWGLDAYAPYPERANPAAQQIMRNVLDRYVDD